MDRRPQLRCLRSLHAQATALAAGRGKTTHFAVLVDRFADVLHTGVVANSIVEGVNHDDLIELVYGVLSHPV